MENIDTILKITTKNSTFTDDDSGVGTASAIGFYAQAGETVYINIVGYGSASGETVFALRRQKFTAFTFDGSNDYGINTVGDYNIPRDYMYNYSCRNVVNPLVSDFAGRDESGIMLRSWSDVILFAGHGYQGYPVFLNARLAGGGLLTPSFKVLQGTKFIFWAICEGANYDNVAYDSIKAGAKTSMGWTKSVNTNSATKFTNQFFLEAGNSMSVEKAAISAANKFWLADACKDYVIYGDKNLVINNQKIQSRSIEESENLVESDEFNEFINKDEYEIIPLKGNGDRYYKLLNGYKTNDYLDVYYDDMNEIQKIVKSSSQIQQDENSINRERTIEKLSVELQECLQKDNISEHSIDYVYAKDNDILRLIRIDYITYSNNDTSETLEQIYTDVNTGENISFEDIYNMR